MEPTAPFRAESGEVLLSIQLTLAGEEDPAEVIGRAQRETTSRQGHPSVPARPAAPVELSLVDPITGAGTLRALRRDLAIEMRSRGGTHAPSVVGLLVEPCAGIRASEGDEEADALMRAVADVIPFLVRARDRVYRTGPEEFALLMPATGDDGKVAALRRLLASVPKAIAERRLGEVRLVPRRISVRELGAAG